MLFCILTLAFFSLALPAKVAAKPEKKAAEKQEVSGLELGAELPELQVTNQDGEKVPLAAAEGDQYVLVFFYPKAMTGG